MIGKSEQPDAIGCAYVITDDCRLFRRCWRADPFSTSVPEESNSKGNDAEDPSQLAKLLYARLEAVEPVDEAALVRLADSRAQAIVDELREKLRVAPERLNTLSSVAVEKNGPTAAALSLEIMR